MESVNFKKIYSRRGIQKLNITWRVLFWENQFQCHRAFSKLKKSQNLHSTHRWECFCIECQRFSSTYILQLCNFNILTKLLKTVHVSNNLDFPLVPNLPCITFWPPPTGNRIYIGSKYDYVQKPVSFQFAHSNFQKCIAVYICTHCEPTFLQCCWKKSWCHFQNHLKLFCRPFLFLIVF